MSKTKSAMYFVPAALVSIFVVVPLLEKTDIDNFSKGIIILISCIILSAVLAMVDYIWKRRRK